MLPSPRSTLHAPRSTLYALLPTLLLLPGCAYHLQGLVVAGPTPAVLLLDQDDPRLQQPGLTEARLQATIDPRAMHPRAVSPAVTDSAGRFSIDVTEPGAGLLRYELLLVIQHGGLRPIEHFMSLPGGDQRLLIIMTPGPDQYTPGPFVPEDPFRGIPPEAR